jgi:DNA primase
MARFGELTRPKRREWTPDFPRSGRTAARGGRTFVPQRQPASAEAKAVGSAGLGAQLGRAVLGGLLRHPEMIAEHAEAIASLAFLDRAAQRLRDAMLSAAMLHGELDQQQLNTILAETGASAFAEALRSKNSLAFSFTRRDSDPERARRDLVLVIETLAARPGIDAALDAATARLKEDGDEAAFQEQQRLREARDEADRQLATLIEANAAETD